MENQKPPIEVLRLNDVKNRTGLSRSTIYSLMKKGKFPSQFNLSERAVAWDGNKVQQFIETQAAQGR